MKSPSHPSVYRMSTAYDDIVSAILRVYNEAGRLRCSELHTGEDVDRTVVTKYSPSVQNVSPESERNTYTFDGDTIEWLVNDARKWAVGNGILMVTDRQIQCHDQDVSSTPRHSTCTLDSPQNMDLSILCFESECPAVEVAPISCLPSPFPQRRFEQACSASVDFNLLVDILTCSPRWLFGELRHLLDIDEFIGHLIRIMDRVYLRPFQSTGRSARCISSDIRLHMLRVDYMLDDLNQGEPYNDSGTVGSGEDGSTLNCASEPLPLKLVEINTIASSFAGLSQRLSKFHRMICSRIVNLDGVKCENAINDEIERLGTPVEPSPNLSRTPNDSIFSMAKAIAEANKAYIRWRKCGRGGFVVLTVVAEDERNVFDQRILLDEAEQRCDGTLFVQQSMQQLVRLWQERTLVLEGYEGSYLDVDALASVEPLKPGRLILRRLPVQQLNQSGSCTASGGVAWNVRLEISVIYFRQGYDPRHFPTEREWRIREILEVSDAVKVPTVPAQLAGTKKIQQLISQPVTEYRLSLLRRFLEDDASVERVNNLLQVHVDPADLKGADQNFKTYVGSNSKRDLTVCSATRTIMEHALKYPNLYILKPQREGGGNNLHGQELCKYLRRNMHGCGHKNDTDTDTNGLDGCVLVKRMFPPVTPALLLRPQNRGRMPGIPGSPGIVKCVLASSVAELGVFGSMVVDGTLKYSDQSNILVNECSGWLVRTKPSTSDEGGVAAGFGCIDSPLVLPDDVASRTFSFMRDLSSLADKKTT